MIVTVVGARPQFVKAAVVSRALSKLGVDERIIHTGQHYDAQMSAVFWEELGLPPVTINLDVGSGHQGAQTARMLERLEDFLLVNRDSTRGVLVYGDTNSTLAAALAAAKLQIPLIHVEAGLRSYNMEMPEEINRIVTDRLSRLLFCPSQASVQTLEREGITAGVHMVGDVMYDALVAYSDRASAAVTELPGPDEPYVVMTIHRASNTDDKSRIEAILKGVGMIDAQVIWPVHPRVRSLLGGLSVPANVHPVRPASYFEMLRLLQSAEAVVTDSGGLQKEAYWSKKRCITTRAETEWTETLHGGWNRLVDTDPASIRSAFLSQPTTSWMPLYGSGSAAAEIALHISRLAT